MPLRDFVRESVTVKGVVCHKPTLETIVLLTGLFGAELAATVGAFNETSQNAVWGDIPKAIRSVAPHFTSDERIVRVLASCCSPPEAVTVEAAEDLLVAVASLCNVPRIAASLDMSSGIGSGPTAEESGLFALSKQFEISPMDLMRMPYEAVLTMIESINGTSSRPAYLVGNELAHLGVTVTKAGKPN